MTDRTWKHLEVSCCIWSTQSILASTFLKFKSKFCESSPFSWRRPKGIYQIPLFPLLCQHPSKCAVSVQREWIETVHANSIEIKKKNQNCRQDTQRRWFPLDLKPDFLSTFSDFFQALGAQAYAYVLPAWKHNWFLWWLGILLFFNFSFIFIS